MGGRNSVGRVTAFQAVGRGFDSRRPLQYSGEDIAHVAQSAEHVLGKDGVSSSILLVGSTSATTIFPGGARSHVQAEIRAHEAARERGDDRSRGSREDDVDGGDHEGVGEQRDGGVRSVRPDRQGTGGAGAGDHDRDGARGVPDEEPSLCARGLPGACRLHQEHDHGGGADGRRDPGGGGDRRSDAADAGAHPVGAAGGGTADRGVPEQGGRGGRPGAFGPGGAGGSGAVDEVRVSGGQDPDHPGLGPQSPGGRQGGDGGGVDREADGGGGQLHSDAGAGHRQAVFDGDRGRLFDFGPRDGGDGPGGARGDQGRGRGGDFGDPPDAEDGGHGRGDVPEASGPGSGGGQHRGFVAGDEEGRGGARAGAGASGVDHAAPEVQGLRLHPDEGRGGPSHPVFQRVPSAVLFPDDGRDGDRGVAGGGGDGDAGGQRADDGGADRTGGDGEGAAVRDPRGRPHRGRRRRLGNPGIATFRTGSGERYERHHHAGVFRVQDAELHHDEEQEDHDGQAGAEEILPGMQEAYGAQGNQVAGGT